MREGRRVEKNHNPEPPPGENCVLPKNRQARAGEGSTVQHTGPTTVAAAAATARATPVAAVARQSVICAPSETAAMQYGGCCRRFCYSYSCCCCYPRYGNSFRSVWNVVADSVNNVVRDVLYMRNGYVMSMNERRRHYRHPGIDTAATAAAAAAVAATARTGPTVLHVVVYPAAPNNITYI